MYGEKGLSNHRSLKKPSQFYSEKPSPDTRELKYARNDSGRRIDKETSESQLQEAKITVKDLTMKIEQSNSRAKARVEYAEKLKSESSEGEDSHQYQLVMRELKAVKQEMVKLKEEMAALLEEKRRAEKETLVSNLRVRTLMSTLETMKEGIEETNEEQVLVELAQIEAIKEFEATDSERKKDAAEHSAAMDRTKKKLSPVRQEVDGTKDLEQKLMDTTSDVCMLESQLRLLKESDHETPSTDSPCLLKSITKELEEAKNELASVKEESFKFMASMDIIRTELRNVSEEAARAKKKEVKTELALQNLNAKILRGQAKLEAAAVAEEKARDIESNLSKALEQLKTEAEAAKKEKELIDEETVKIGNEVEKTESEIEMAEERLEVAIEELKAVKASESMALGKLQTLIENTVKRRFSESQRSSVITISSFEYEYLKGRASGAEEIADKKVAAAQAWIEAMKASEREILMRTEMAKKELRELKIVGDQDGSQPRQSLHAKRKVETQMEKWKLKYDEIMESEKPLNTSGLLGRSSSRNGGMLGKSSSRSGGQTPRSTPKASSFTVRRRRRSMVLPKFLNGKNTNKSTEAH